MLLWTLHGLSEKALVADLHSELKLADNSFTNNTRDLLDKARQEFTLPLVYIFEPRQGQSYALNAAILQAKGQILVFAGMILLRTRVGWLFL